VALKTSQLPLHPSTHRVHIPEPGTTLRERLEVCVASLAFGCCRFMLFSFADSNERLNEKRNAAMHCHQFKL
jgi:hypothetical protein